MTDPKYVNNSIDKIIRLAEIRSFEKAAKSTSVRYPVRVMQIYDATRFQPGKPVPADEVKTSAILEEWSAKKISDFRELMISLTIFASTPHFMGKNRIETTQLDPYIIEIKDCGQRLRLFAFVANDEVIVVAEHYQKHGLSPKDERRFQDKAIRRATARRNLFLNARKVGEDFYEVRKADKRK